MEGKSAGDLLLDGINEVYNDVKHYTLEERKQYVTEVTDYFLEEEGEMPPSKVLNRLGDLILYDYLEGDSRSNKAQAEEYSILTEAQYLRRTIGQNQSRQTHGITYVESPTDDFSTYNLEPDYINLEFLENIEKDLD